MEQKLFWKNAEEGIFSFFESGSLFMSVQIFITGEEEAELKIQDIVLSDRVMKNANMQEKVISKINECIKECFLQLWNREIEEIVLVVDSKSEYAEILGSTDVVYAVYSEYMMEHEAVLSETTSSRVSQQKESEIICLEEDEEGLLCKNKAGTFFCRLLKYPEKDGYYLYEVEVEKKKRNCGIATACLQSLLVLLGKKVYLQVGSYNEPAVHVYKKLGFCVSEELCYYTLSEQYIPE